MNTATDRNVVVGVFGDRTQAQRALDELRRAGFREEQLGVAARDATATTGATDLDSGTKAEEGAAVGALAGAGVGALWAIGIAAGMLPAIGPIIAGGTLAAILASAAGGAAVAGVVGALIGMGIPEEEAQYYETEFHAGRTLITVRTEGRNAEATSILNRCGAFDIDRSKWGTTHRTLDVPVNREASTPRLP